MFKELQSTLSTEAISGHFGRCSFGHVLSRTMTRRHFGVLRVASTCGLTGLYGVTSQMLTVRIFTRLETSSVINCEFQFTAVELYVK